jgi:hypothetical protein
MFLNDKKLFGPIVYVISTTIHLFLNDDIEMIINSRIVK